MTCDPSPSSGVKLVGMHPRRTFSRTETSHRDFAAVRFSYEPSQNTTDKLARRMAVPAIAIRIMLSVDEALKRVLQHAAPLAPQPCERAAALGLVLGEDIAS